MSYVQIQFIRANQDKSNPLIHLITFIRKHFADPPCNLYQDPPYDLHQETLCFCIYFVDVLYDEGTGRVPISRSSMDWVILRDSALGR